MNNIDPILYLSLAIVLFLVFKYIQLYLKTKKIEYEFTSIVNHTFRTPLTRIMWISKELEKDMPMHEKLLQLQNLTNATSKLLEIVDLIAGVKDIKNTSGYFFEAISLRDIVEKSISKYRAEINKKNLTFQVSAFKSAPLLTVDIKKISFVVDALVENAIIYTPSNGTVLIDYKIFPRYLNIHVTDTGIGLSWRDKMRIFSRFYRSKRAVLVYPDGMGLRLYLAKQIIARHHGELGVTSKGINKGATFFLKLPLKR